jgi:hypothetical protein
MAIRHKNISLPHIGYTVRVRPPKLHPDGTMPPAWTEEASANHCVVYLPANADPCMVSHELVHVLQHICHVRDMAFLTESEHTAYLMQYLMGEILGYRWER